jgi:hypothetical protein
MFQVASKPHKHHSKGALIVIEWEPLVILRSYNPFMNTDMPTPTLSQSTVGKGLKPLVEG